MGEHTGPGKFIYLLMDSRFQESYQIAMTTSVLGTGIIAGTNLRCLRALRYQYTKWKWQVEVHQKW